MLINIQEIRYIPIVIEMHYHSESEFIKKMLKIKIELKHLNTNKRVKKKNEEEEDNYVLRFSIICATLLN